MLVISIERGKKLTLQLLSEPCKNAVGAKRVGGTPAYGPLTATELLQLTSTLKND